MPRKVFISILGDSFYTPCRYVGKDGFCCTTRYIQEATLHYINAANWSTNDTVLIALTQKAKYNNWTVIERQNKSGETAPYKGLRYVLQEMKLPFDISEKNEIDIPNGENENQIWKIFEAIFNAFIQDDELYFDITHGFRYLPMLVLVLNNYAKALKNVTVKHISYGNFVFPGEDKPIIDLLPLSQLQDWTFAAAQYLDSGNVERLIQLSNKELRPILKESEGTDPDANTLKNFVKYLKVVIEERQTCRGMQIINSSNFRKLKKYSDQITSSLIEPLTPIILKIKDSFTEFDVDENIANGFAAARWCLNNGLYQQAATILQENVVTFFCIRHHIPIDDENQRKIINSAFRQKALQKDSEEQDIKVILQDDLFNNMKLVNAFSQLTSIRNDINHNGMRSRQKPLDSDKIRRDIANCVNNISQILC